MKGRSMKSPIFSLLTLLVLVAPASAKAGRHHRTHHHGHIVGTHAQHGEVGFPITAAKDSIRINAVGEVISQPVPVIQKEQNFNNRAKQDLTAHPQSSSQPSQVAPPQQQP